MPILFQTAEATVTPNTTDFLYGGLAVVTLVILIFIVSLYLRFQNVRKDIALAEQLAEE
jgi:cell division protein FtsL